MKSAANVLKKKTAFKEEMDRRFPAADSEKAWQKAHALLDSFYQKYADLPKGVKLHTDSFIFPAAAIYLAMREIDPDQAFAVMTKVMKERSEKIGGKLAGFTKLPGARRLFMNIWDPMCRNMFGEKSGFQNVFYPKEKDVYRMDITACPYHKYLTELGCPEINRLFCENDVYTYGSLPGIRFIRTKTIGQGDELCNFRLELEK